MRARMVLCSTLLSVGIIASSLTPAFASLSNDSFITGSKASVSTTNSQKEDGFTPKISAIDDILHPTFISGELSEKTNESPEKIVEKYYSKELSSFADNKTSKQLEIGNEAKKEKKLKVKEQSKNSKDKTVVNTVQTYNGVPVFGTNQSYTINSDGVIECIIGSTVEDIDSKVASSESSIQTTQQGALNAVEKDLGFKPTYIENPKLELLLYPVGEKYVYTYEVSVDYMKPDFGGYTYYIDANSLSIIKKFNHVNSVEQATVGTGYGQFGQSSAEKMNLNIVVDDTNKYYLKNTVENFKTVNLSGDIFSESDNCFDNPDTEYLQDAVDAHYNVSYVINFFKEMFNRNGAADSLNSNYSVIIDDNWLEINAQATPFYTRFSTMRSISTNRSFASSLDVAGHEFTHSVMATEGLGSTGEFSETDALNEGLADVFGTICEYYYFKDSDTVKHNGTNFDWQVGEDTKPGSRDDSNPDIDTYEEYITREPEAHEGGGIITKAAYLIAEGGTHNGITVPVISNDEETAYEQLAQIFYYVIKNYIGSIQTFSQFAQSAVETAELLYPNTSADDTVWAAFASVGVLMPGEAPTNFAETGNRNGMNIEFSWDGTAGDSYAIYRSDSLSLVKFDSISGCIGTAETLYGGTHFYVAKVDSNGNRISAYSNMVTVTIYSAAPQNFAIDSKVGTAITFSWDDSPDAKYMVCGYNSSGIMVTGEMVDCATTVTVNIPYGDTYDFSVAKIKYENLRGRISEFSNVIRVENYGDLPAPANFRITNRSGTIIEFSWEGSSGGKYYSLYRKYTGTTGTPQKVEGTTTTGTSISIVTISGSYDYYVAQDNSYGDRTSSFSNSVTVENYNTAPTNLVKSSISGSDAIISWDAPGKLVGVYLKPTGSTTFLGKIATANGTTARFYFSAGSFDCFIAEVDSYGNRISEFSNVITIERYSWATPNFEMSSRNGSEINFSWDGLSGRNYKIYRKLAGSTDTPAEVIDATTTSTTGSTIAITGTYDYYVAEVNMYGNRITEFSNAVTVENYLTAPANFVLTNKVGMIAFFSWDGTSGNNYKIYRRASGTTDVLEEIYDTTDTTGWGYAYDDGAYDFYVAQVDSEGNRISNFSDVVTVGTI